MKVQLKINEKNIVAEYDFCKCFLAQKDISKKEKHEIKQYRSNIANRAIDLYFQKKIDTRTWLYCTAHRR